MLILKISKSLKLLKSRDRKYLKTLKMESNILQNFIRAMAVLFVLHFSMVALLFSVYGISLFIFLFLFIYFLVSSIIQPDFKNLNRIIKIKEKQNKELREILKFDFSLEGKIDLLFNEILELKEMGRLEEIDESIINDILTEKKTVKLTNEDKVNQFLEYNLKEENYNKIINE